MAETGRYDVTISVTMEVDGEFGPDEAVVRAVRAVRKGTEVPPHEQVDGVDKMRVRSMSVMERRQ